MLRLRAHDADELSHYSAGTSDVEFVFPWGWDELEGIANRTDYDLTQHAKFSGERLDYFDQATGERYVPHVIEPAAGATRTMAAFLLAAYDEDEVGGRGPHACCASTRAWRRTRWPCCRCRRRTRSRRWPRRSSTCWPSTGWCDYDDTQSIGRRYRRQDEIGTPLAVTVDFDSLEDQAVTIRDRDTTEQVRVPVDGPGRGRPGAPRVLKRARRRGKRQRRAAARLGRAKRSPCRAVDGASRLARRALRLRLRSQAPPPADGPEGSARRQGRQPRGDDERARAAGAARLHHHHRRLPCLHGRRLAGRARRGDRQAGLPPREEDGPQARRPVRPAARQRALGRQVLDAGHDGHRPEPRASTTRACRAWPRSPATSASPTTPTAGSSRCTGASCSASRPTCSTSRSRRPRPRPASPATPRSRPPTLHELCEEYKRVVRAEHGRRLPAEAARAAARAPSRPCSRAGTAPGPSPTGCASASATTSAPP